MAEPDDNPIAARIDRLQDQWTLFVRKADARVLRWVVAEDELALVEGFFIREGHPEASKTPDLFWTCEAPFRDAGGHGIALREELCGVYESARPELVQAGIGAAWHPPPVRREATDVEAWLETLQSFRAAHEGVAILGVCLRPGEVAAITPYTGWLQRLARAAPSELRFIVLDASATPAFDVLAVAEPKRVWTQRANLDVPAALEELSASAGSLETPGGKFRHLYVRMGGAAKDGDLGAVEALGAQALAISEPQRWFALSCAVHFVQGSLLMRAGRHHDAFQQFMNADGAGARADAEGDSQGRKLRVQARLSAGSALLGGKDYRHAAVVFAEVAPFAREAQETRAELDAWRLASHCYAQTGDAGKTWAAAEAALAVGRSMDEETRSTSTLKNLGQSLLYWAKEQKRADVESTVQHELDAMLGEGWAS
ncbi:MAG: hypothetical protein M3O36_21385 [Myxococcota bacterium]|nr:hypothetical protein [Myxococcota bacterium]